MYKPLRRAAGFAVLALCAAALPTVTATPAMSAPAPELAAAATPRPNIVFISVDDMRVNDLWAMPNVKALLTDQGTTFTNSYAPFPLCCPARANWVTGQYNHNNGVWGNLTADFPVGGYAALDGSNTVATWLRGAGYQTAFVGKYLNGYGTVKPTIRPPGWLDWHASVAGGNYFSTKLREKNGASPIVTNTYNGPYQVDLYDDIATNIIAQRVPAAAPLFLWVSDYAPHSGAPKEDDDPAISTPAVPPRYKNYFAAESLQTDPSYNEADVSDKPPAVSSLNKLTLNMQAMLKESYQQRLESLKAVDDSVGHIVSALAASGELNNTVIAFSNDNGYMMGEHRIHAGKTVAYEPSARVPLIIRGPGFPAGVSRTPWVANIDVAPTFAAIAQTTPALDVDGRSLLPLAASPTGWSDRTMVLEAGPSTVDGPDRYHGILEDGWKYLEYSDGVVEFYNLNVDPYELSNLANNPAYDVKQEQLHQRLLVMQNCAGAACR